jgi:hypothetical protein
VLATGSALAWFQIFDSDMFWHLKAGEEIISRGRVPRENIFSWTFPDHLWVNAEWLFQIVLAWSHQTAGWLGIACLKLLLVGLIGTALFVACTATAPRPWSAAAWTTMSLAVMRFRFTERPHLFSYFFFAVLLGILARRARGDRRGIWALPLLFALWSNVHTEFVIALLYLGGVVAVEAACRRARAGCPADPADHLPIIALLCIPASLVNPFSWRALVFPFLHVNLGAVLTVTEFQSSLARPMPRFWLALVVAVAVLALRRREVRWADVLPLGGLAVLAVCYLRTIPFFALAAAPLLHARWIPPRCAGKERAARRASAILLGGAITVFLGAMTVDNPALMRRGHGVNERHFPIAAANLLAAEPFPPPLFNTYDDGGYLIFRLWPRYGVFQDGRCLQAYPRAFFARLNRRHPPPDWRGILSEYGVNSALVRRNELPAMGFDPREWGMVHWDDAWCLLLRRGPAAAPLLERLEYRVYLPGADFSRWPPSALTPTLAEIRRNQAARLSPSAGVANDMGATLAALSRIAESIAAFEEAVRLDPDFALAWVNLGRAHLAAGDGARAASALKRALRLDPDVPDARTLLESAGAPPP